jgi:hypothetical protein
MKKTRKLDDEAIAGPDCDRAFWDIVSDNAHAFLTRGLA